MQWHWRSFNTEGAGEKTRGREEVFDIFLLLIILFVVKIENQKELISFIMIVL